MAVLQSKNNERSSIYPIAYGSKTLTSAETRDANIERTFGHGWCPRKVSLFYFWMASDHSN